VDMPTVGDLSSATMVALRRNQERVSGKQPYRISANRQARLLMPGQLFTIPEVDVAMICMENELRDPTDLEAKITALPNYYGIEASSAVIHPGGGLEPNIPETEEDLAIIPFEIPETISDTLGKVRLGVARVRAHAQILRSNIYISNDDITFFKISEEGGVHIGGVFNDDIAAEDVGLQAAGIEFTELGPDITSVLDLTPSGQRAVWRRGKQLLLTEAGEAMFVRGVTSLGGDQWRVEQPLRGRLDTVRQAHSAGDKFIILADDQITSFTDLLLLPGDTIYLKVQPVGADSMPLDELESIPFTIYGKGIRPRTVRQLRAVGGGNHYSFGDDVDIQWGYLSEEAPKTGAGEQGAGTAIAAPAPPDGTFHIKLYAPNGGALVREASGLTEPIFTYTWAMLVADFGWSPGFSGTGHFDVEVTHVRGSLVSAAATLNVFGTGVAP